MSISSKFDIAVIGAGHAGIEAALAGARLGLRTFVFTMNLDSIGNCPCNPSIGGTAKGHLVKEIDALGGAMGKVADECCIQSRMLNVGKGAAVQSLRMQIDRTKYKNLMKHALEKEKNLYLKQAEIVSVSLVDILKNVQIEQFNIEKSQGISNFIPGSDEKSSNIGKNIDDLNNTQNLNFITNKTSDDSCNLDLNLHKHNFNVSCEGDGFDKSCSTDCKDDCCKHDVPKYLEFKENSSIKSCDVQNLTNIIEDLAKKNNGYIWIITTRLGTRYLARSVIITTGTYLNSKIFVGRANYSSGPDGLFPSNYLSDSLSKLGIRFLRFKTGTPARVLRSSIDFSNLKEQIGDPEPESFSDYKEEDSYGINSNFKNKVNCSTSLTIAEGKGQVIDPEPESFSDYKEEDSYGINSNFKNKVNCSTSLTIAEGKGQIIDPDPESFSNCKKDSYETDGKVKNKVTCYISWTTPKTKEIILKNIDKSPVYSGDITGTGPRYCPSIEDKIVRFKDKDRHQLFIEPCGEDTEEMYLQGMSSGLPEDVQNEFYKSIPGLENVEIMRPAYAIEYDCADPIQLTETLEFKNIPYLFGAGQFNGSSGYEEAAAQGLVAGINAALKILGKDKLILTRSNSYIGTLIDDLVTKGVKEPYRMMTARSEYRLLLRQDNAYERLSPIGHKLGLVSDETYSRIEKDINLKKEEIKRLKSTVIPPSKKVNEFLVSRETSKITTGVTLYDLLKRPQLAYDDLFYINDSMPKLKKHIRIGIEAEVKYSGYISKQEKEIKDLKRLEDQKLPLDIDYLAVHGLRMEAREKLNKFKPSNVGMAARIAGVNPADITVLLVYLARSKNSS